MIRKVFLSSILDNEKEPKQRRIKASCLKIKLLYKICETYKEMGYIAEYKGKLWTRLWTRFFIMIMIIIIISQIINICN